MVSCPPVIYVAVNYTQLYQRLKNEDQSHNHTDILYRFSPKKQLINSFQCGLQSSAVAFGSKDVYLTCGRRTDLHCHIYCYSLHKRCQTAVHRWRLISNYNVLQLLVTIITVYLPVISSSFVF